MRGILYGVVLSLFCWLLIAACAMYACAQTPYSATTEIKTLDTWQLYPSLVDEADLIPSGIIEIATDGDQVTIHADSSGLATNTVQITDDRWGGYWQPGEADHVVNLVYSTRQLLTIEELPGLSWPTLDYGEGLITFQADPLDAQNIIGYTLHRGQWIADNCLYPHAVWHSYFSEDYDPSLAHVGGLLRQAGEPRGRMKSLWR